jgi:hypothetical protein
MFSADLYAHDLSGAVELDYALGLEDRISIEPRDGDKNTVAYNARRMRARDIFQTATSPAKLGQGESHIGQLAGFRNREGDVHQEAGFHTAFLGGWIKRRLERYIEKEAVFFGIEHTARYSKGHKDWKLYHIGARV